MISVNSKLGGFQNEQKNYGYVQVSTKDQSETRQLIAMRSLDLPKKNIFLDKQSGKNFQRSNYLKMVKKLKRDDLLYIKSIGWLGRNYVEITEQWRALTKEKGIDIVVLDMPLLNTRRDKDLLGSFLSDIVLQVLSFVAENERVDIRSRQAEGIAAVKARDVHFGPQPRAMPDSFPALYRAWRSKEISLRKTAMACVAPKSTSDNAALRLEKQGVEAKEKSLFEIV